LFSNCASRRPIILENVYAQPDIDFGAYRKIANVGFIASPDIKADKNFNVLVEEEFNKSGYDVVGTDEFTSFLDELGYSSEGLLDPDSLRRIRERLGVTAIIRGTVQEYEIKKKKGHMPFIIGEGVILIEETDYICDISLNIEMIETTTGNNVWSCSVSCSEKKGKPEKLIRNMIRDSLSTIP
jgi:hypothetical protein